MLPTYWRDFGGAAELPGLRLSGQTMSDGHRLTLYEFGAPEAPLMAIVNPYAYPFLLLGPLAVELGRSFHVLSWENRTAPFLGPSPRFDPSAIERLAQDLHEVLTARSRHPAHVVAWRDGSHIATTAAAELGTPFRTMSLIAPGDIGMAAPSAQRAMLPLLAQATGPGAEARLPGIFNIFKIATGRRPAGTEIDQQIWRLCDLNFDTPEVLGRFANVLRHVSQEAPLRAGEDLKGRHLRLFKAAAALAPIQILHCEDDEIVAVDGSREAGRISGARLDVQPGGSHHAAYRQPELLAPLIREFALSGQVTGAPHA